MPRRRKDEQAPQAAPGQPYGESGEQIAAQNVIPLPQRQTVPAAGSPTPPEPAAGAPPVDDLATALAAATATPPPQGGLFGPSTRPAEPVTAGLPLGAGPGPEALGPSRAHARTVADTFRLLADVTGNPMYRRMAQAASAQGH